MFAWLRRLGSRKPDPDALRNDALGLAMDWGEQWLAPVQGRLAEMYPQLPRTELDELDALAREAMQFAHQTILAFAARGDQGLTEEDFSARFSAQYPWANAENVARMYRQGTYYAWKAGGPAKKIL